MIISVIGTGAIGGYYGAKLAKSGQEVHFLLHRDYDYVRKHGLYVKSCDGDFSLDKVNAYNTTTTKAEFHEARWRKAVWNIPFNGMSVVYNTTTDRLIDNKETRNLIITLMHEVIDAARACGVKNLDYSFADQMMEVTETMVPYSPSMKLDYEFHRPMELHYMYERPLAAARNRHCPMPETTKLYNRLKEIDLSNI